MRYKSSGKTKQVIQNKKDELIKMLLLQNYYGPICTL